MAKLARIEEVSSDCKVLTATSLISSACINCPSVSACHKNRKRYTVTNMENKTVKKGDYITVVLPSFAKNLTGLICLFVPILMALAGYFFSPAIIKITGLSYSELTGFLTALFFLLAGEILVMLFSKSNLHIGTMELQQTL